MDGSNFGGRAILVDTREQLPLWNSKEPMVLRVKLDVGDYTTDDLLGKAHIERKSPIDLYGSLVQGHERFRREILSAGEHGIKIAVFTECSLPVFINKKFHGGARLKVEPSVLSKIVDTMETKYKVDFFWCSGRHEMKDNMLMWFERQRQLVGTNG